MSLYLDTLSLFRANPCLPLLLNAACLAIIYKFHKWTLEETKGTIKNEQSRETGKIGCTAYQTTETNKTKVGPQYVLDMHHYKQRNTNNVNKTWAIGSIDQTQHRFYAETEHRNTEIRT